MGVVNVTPDSFYPASRALAMDEALALGRRHFFDGADVVDVGGESTRPGAVPVDESDELARVVPVVRVLASEGSVSIDTQKEPVARAAVAAGALIINDVSSTLVDVAGELQCSYVAMHRQGVSATMQDHPSYEDVVEDIGRYLRGVAERARRTKIAQLWLDPGIGFGKTVEHNLALLAHCDYFVDLAREFDAGVLVGTSRKRFLENLSATPLDVDQRLEGTMASEAWAMVQGVSMVRVHDVREAVQLRELLARPLEIAAT
jgi:dihydropteroate synthase